MNVKKRTPDLFSISWTKGNAEQVLEGDWKLLFRGVPVL